MPVKRPGKTSSPTPPRSPAGSLSGRLYGALSVAVVLAAAAVLLPLSPPWVLHDGIGSDTSQKRMTDEGTTDTILQSHNTTRRPVDEKHFAGDTLAYVTPWNRRGYDIAKVFSRKFTYISPVWLQMKANPKGKESRARPVIITGEQDVDAVWIEDVRGESGSLAPKIVPRMIVEGFTLQQLESILGSRERSSNVAETLVDFLMVSRECR